MTMGTSKLVVGFCCLCLQVLNGLRLPFTEELKAERTSVQFLAAVNHDRVRRDNAISQNTEPGFPERATARLRVSGHVVHLSLQRNSDIDVNNIPVFMLVGSTVEQVEQESNKDHALYQDPTTGGSFLITEHRDNTTAEVYHHIFGTFHHNSSQYVIQPSDTSEDNGQGHIVARVPDKVVVFESVTPKVAGDRSSSGHTLKENHGNRRSRRQIEKYYVELFSVVDYQSYKNWYDMTSGSSRSSDAIQMVRLYMAYILNGMDMRYNAISTENLSIDILSAGIFIADTELGSTWSGSSNSDTLLDTFTEWIQQQNNLPQYDHAMAFTGYDIVSDKGGDNSGVAFPKSLCTAHSTSVVEERLNFVAMTTAAHELGHSIGALHDGIDNTCKEDDNYIMASRNSVLSDLIKGPHLWEFSPCSVKEFKSYIAKLDEDNNNCMLTTSNASDVVTTAKPMAEEYSPDYTCRFRFGDGSYVCRSIQVYETLCTSMFCNQPGTTLCYAIIPAESTPCAKGKWCEMGKCVASPRASSVVDDNCPLGDRDGLFENTGKTCPELIAEEAGSCYGDFTGANCCNSCNGARTGVSGCEFGDHNSTFCSLMPRHGCYNNEEYCCAKCKPLKDTTLPAVGCEFGDRFSGCNKNHCPFYDAQNLAGCCETCYDPSSTVKPPTTTTTNKPTTTTEKPTTTTTKTTTTTEKTTTTATTTTTTTKTTTPPPTTKTTTTPTQTTTTSKSTIKQTDTTAEATGQTKPDHTSTTSTEVPIQEKASEMLVIVVGCGVGALAIIALIVVLCIVLKRRKAKMSAGNGRKRSMDNTYDNTGFMSGSTEQPTHAPPRRGSNSSSQRNTSNGSAVVVDGYMMPATSHITTSNGVHYTAPNKPKCKPLVPPNKPQKKAFAGPKPCPELPLRTSKPVHYKRTSNMSNISTLSRNDERVGTMTWNNERAGTITDNSEHTGTMSGKSERMGTTTEISESINNISKNAGVATNGLVLPDAYDSIANVDTSVLLVPDTYDSIGDIQKIHQTRKPTLPENHPSSLSENQTTDRTNVINKLNSDLMKRKVLPPIPIPRMRSKEKIKGDKLNIDYNSNNTTSHNKPERPTVNKNMDVASTPRSGNMANGYAQADSVGRIPNNDKPTKPPTKPVPRRQISTASSENDKPALPLKKPLRPPMKPVPRRRSSSENTSPAHINLSFDDELEYQI